MIANLVVIAFVVLMAYYWYTQGLFSAFLHLVAVVVAGALAFAFWEPAAYFLLGTGRTASHFAWGVSLVGLFFIMLSIIRLSLDRLVPGNVQFPNLLNLVAGAVCGLASGILTAGIMVIGLGFLPMQADLAGYQPYAVGPVGNIERTDDRLWLQVDDMAAGFFTRLSTGTFAPFGSETTLASHRPELAAQAAIFRLSYDQNASLVAAPDGVAVERLFEHNLPSEDLADDLVDALGPDAGQNGRKLVVVETSLDREGAVGTYDADGTARIPPTQVQLITLERDGGRTRLHRHNPVAFAKNDVASGTRRLHPFATDRVVAYTSDAQATFAWTFVPPAHEEPQFLLFRQLRIPLADQALVGDADRLVAALGRPVEPVVEDEDADDDDDQARSAPVGERDGTPAGNAATEIQQTNALPNAVSKNHIRNLQTQGNNILSGRASVDRHTGRLSDNTRVDGIHHPSHVRMVRLQVEVDQARSLLGASRAAAASLGGVTLEDHRDRRHEPIGYVWLKANGEQEIAVDLTNPIRSARQLPLSNMRSDDELYLYFTVSPGLTITRYWVGPETSQEVNFEVQ
ncbi:MAG: CvpA family protein [Phycisphaeraceae bacterium]